MQSTPDATASVPAYHLLELPPPPDDRPYILVNMVLSTDGRAVVEGTERGLGSPADQRLMRELRSLADIVFNGAGTLRASGSSSRLNDPVLEDLRESRGRPRVPLAAVITASGDVPLERALFTADDFDAVIYVGAAAPEERVRAIEATGRRVFRLPERNELRSMLRHMRQELGARVLLVEGGPSTNGQLFDLGVVDEFFLTLAPRVVGGRDALPAVRSDRPRSAALVTPLELLSAVPNQETSEVYLRYRPHRD